MAKISLREYVREIESQIDRGDTQKAIAHCKHLLRYYPKHIDTYRLFGKSLLEMQKYGDASDIFQRVLSSVPDDFISQIGMSIIKEDENNLDAAIWHLERAFEIQPSNKAVQDELKRLYASRDGVVPNKIRLTRGALVRMYARGELYAQAIAEIKAALVEDPNRVDLEVILSRLFYMVGQKADATETASNLITKLPYCYEANRILAEILPGTSRHEDALIFRQRVIDLDPYFEFVNAAIPNPIDIDDGKIMVEMLDWDPSMAESDQPDWAKSIGLDWDAAEKQTDPELDHWLSNEMDLSNSSSSDDSVFNNQIIDDDDDDDDDDENAQPLNSQAEPTADPITFDQSDDLTTISLRSSNGEDTQRKKPEENIPAWLSEVGWAVSQDNNPELEKGFNLPDAEQEEDVMPMSSSVDEEREIEPGIIPDWVKKLAPKEELRSEGIIDADDQLIDDKNFERLFSPQNQTFEEESFFDGLEANQSWINEFAKKGDSPKSQLSTENEMDEALIDSAPVEELVSEATETSAILAEEPASITEGSQENVSQVSDLLETSEIPFEEEDEAAEDEYDRTITPEEISKPADTSWFKDLIPSDVSDSSESEIEEEIEDRSFLSFLPDIGDSEPAQPAKQSSDQSDFSWLNALQSSVGDEDEAQIPEEIQSTQEQSIESEQDAEFDLSRFMEPQATEMSMSEATSELPDFTLEEKTPDWVETIMGAIPEETDLPESPVSHQPVSEPSQSIEDSSSEEIESAFAWMEGLASKHGAADETLFSEPDNRSTTPPEWIKELQEEPVDESPDPFMEASRKSQADFLEDDLTPSWLKALQDEAADMEDVPDQEISEQSTSESDSLFPDEVIDQELIATNFIDVETIEAENEIIGDIQLENDELPEGVKTREEMMITPVDQDGQEEIEDDLLETPLDDSDSEFETELEMDLQALSSSDQADSEIPVWLRGYEEAEVSTDQLARSSAETKTWVPEEVFEEFTTQFEQQEEGQEPVVELSEAVSDFDQEPAGDDSIVQESDSTDEDTLEEVTFTTEEIEEQYDNIEETKPETIQKAEVKATEPISLSQDAKQDLESAWQALQKGQISTAVSLYEQLIHSKIALNEVIQHLQESLDHHYPIDISLWMTLGDAYLRSNQLQDALSAYTKAEELIS